MGFSFKELFIANKQHPLYVLLKQIFLQIPKTALHYDCKIPATKMQTTKSTLCPITDAIRRRLF